MDNRAFAVSEQHWPRRREIPILHKPQAFGQWSPEDRPLLFYFRFVRDDIPVVTVDFRCRDKCPVRG